MQKLKKIIIFLAVLLGSLRFSTTRAEQFPDKGHIYCTCADEYHYPLLTNLIASIHTNDYEKLFHIAVYDLGLTRAQRTELNNLAKVTVYDLEKTHPDILTPFLTANWGRKVRGWFAWKPVAIKQTLDIFPYCLYIDAGALILRSPSTLFDHIREHGYFLMEVHDHDIEENMTQLVRNKLVSQLDPVKQSIVMSPDTRTIAAGLQGMSRSQHVYTNYVLPMYELSRDLELFKDDGSAPLGFGGARHDQTVFAIMAYVCNLTIHPVGWMNLSAGGNSTRFHIHWNKTEINRETTIYQCRWDTVTRFTRPYMKRYKKLNPTPKIVGLVAVRNEASIIEQCLRALSLYTDAICILDDASDDNTFAIIEALQNECRIEQVIRKETWYRDEPGDRNALLRAGRAIGGTHFIVIDADEMFTANLCTNNLLRTRILQLQPGQKLAMTWIQLWRSVSQYRYDNSVWSGSIGDFAFCDDGLCSYSSAFIHTPRCPGNLGGTTILLNAQETVTPAPNALDVTTEIPQPWHRLCTHAVLQRCANDLHNRETLLFYAQNPDHIPNCYRNDFSKGLMHFQFVNWDNLLAKQAWYRCLEKIRNPVVNTTIINRIYGESKDETGLATRQAPAEWFAGYSFFNRTVYEQVPSWHAQQIRLWIATYGADYFKELDIWDCVKL